ncbi:MAG: 4'-phosphopantetheinyl transferase superfamily protein [Desulfobacterales bacterium]
MTEPNSRTENSEKRVLPNFPFGTSPAPGIEIEGSATVEKLFPVILPVPCEEYRKLALRERVKFLSRYARHALTISEQLTVIRYPLSENQEDGHPLHIRNCLRENNDLPKDEKGAPMPVKGRWWSVTHKPEYVGAVLSSQPVGMDIEKISLRSERLWEKIADSTEKALIDSRQPDSFFRYWTAKEAVLKAAGTGLTELSQCRIAQVPDADHLILRYRDRDWHVEHFRIGKHLASVIKNSRQVEWHVFPLAPERISAGSITGASPMP